MDNKIEKIFNIFKNNSFYNFFLNEEDLTIELRRENNSSESEIFAELNRLTNTLICLDIDFSVSANGHIIIDG